MWRIKVGLVESVSIYTSWLPKDPAWRSKFRNISIREAITDERGQPRQHIYVEAPADELRLQPFLPCPVTFATRAPPYPGTFRPYCPFSSNCG